MPNSDQESWTWPAPPFEVVLVEPEIPPNTGNIARSCAATGSRLHLVEPLGFSLEEKALRRAGLDYWENVDVTVHSSWGAFEEYREQRTAYFFSTKGSARWDSPGYQPGDFLVFGPETRGLAEGLLSQHADHVRRLPMRTDHVRSLNLATTAGIVLYEALRQHQNF